MAVPGWVRPAGVTVADRGQEAPERQPAVRRSVLKRSCPTGACVIPPSAPLWDQCHPDRPHIRHRGSRRPRISSSAHFQPSRITKPQVRGLRKRSGPKRGPTRVTSTTPRCQATVSRHLVDPSWAKLAHLLRRWMQLVAWRRSPERVGCGDGAHRSGKLDAASWRAGMMATVEEDQPRCSRGSTTEPGEL
jgi:hypothetical protein